MSLLGIIPARGGSKRVRGKNVRKIAGKPLLVYSIEAAKESGIFDELIVSTDDEEICKIARENGAKVPYIRPEHLASDEAQLKDVAEHVINHYKEQDREFDDVMVLPPTSPLRTPADITDAYSKFNDTKANYLISVTDYRYPPVRAFIKKENERIKPYWTDNEMNAEVSNSEELFDRSQEYPEFLADCASIYLFSVHKFLQEKSFHGSDSVGYYVPPERAVDIDDTFDLTIAELIIEDKIDKEGNYELLESRWN